MTGRQSRYWHERGGCLASNVFTVVGEFVDAIDLVDVGRNIDFEHIHAADHQLDVAGGEFAGKLGQFIPTGVGNIDEQAGTFAAVSPSAWF